MDTPTSDSQLSAAALLTPSETFGSYRLVADLGLDAVDDARAGAIPASVFRAEDVDTGTPVLLKVFGRTYSPFDPFVNRFLQAGTRAASFAHPNVVSVYEVGFERELLFVAMLFIEGETLAERMRTGGLSAADAVQLVAPLARAR